MRRTERHISLPFSLCFVSFSGLAVKPRPPRGAAALIGRAAARLHLRATGPYLSSGEPTSSQSQSAAEGLFSSVDFRLRTAQLTRISRFRFDSGGRLKQQLSFDGSECRTGHEPAARGGAGGVHAAQAGQDVGAGRRGGRVRV